MLSTTVRSPLMLNQVLVFLLSYLLKYTPCKEDPDVQREPAAPTLPIKLDRSSGIRISPYVIDTTSQSDSDAASIQIQETIRKDQTLIAPGPEPEDENNDSDSSDVTMPLTDEPPEKINDRLKEVEEE